MSLANGKDSNGIVRPLATNSTGRLQVDVITTSAGGHTDDDPFNAGTDGVTLVAGVCDDTAPDSVDEGDIGACRISSNRSLHVELRDAAGNERGANINASGQVGTIEGNSAAIAASLAVMDDWDATHDDGVASDGPQIMGSARTSQAAAVANGDAARLVCNAYGEVVNAGHTWATTSNRSEEIDPISQHFEFDTIVDETDYDDSGPSTLYYYVDMAGYTRLSLQYDQDAGSGTIVLTIEASWQSDGTAAASCAYEDVTSALTGAASISGTGTGTIIDNAGILEGAKYVRAKYVVNTDPNDDADFTIYASKLYR